MSIRNKDRRIAASKCGCIPGQFLCPEAESLWQAGNAAYERWKRGTGTWDDYQKALRMYYIHTAKARQEGRER